LKRSKKINIEEKIVVILKITLKIVRNRTIERPFLPNSRAINLGDTRVAIFFFHVLTSLIKSHNLNLRVEEKQKDKYRRENCSYFENYFKDCKR